eukprot:730684-Amphidinium_carterae.1
MESRKWRNGCPGRCAQECVGLRMLVGANRSKSSSEQYLMMLRSSLHRFQLPPSLSNDLLNRKGTKNIHSC